MQLGRESVDSDFLNAWKEVVEKKVTMKLVSNREAEGAVAPHPEAADTRN